MHAESIPKAPSAPAAPAAAPCTHDIFVSHCKRTEASEDRAIWVSDISEGEGLKVFFDRSNLTEISESMLRRSVAESAVVVTILDPFTFDDSDWVRLENEVAADHGIPS